jgi:phage protein U
MSTLYQLGAIQFQVAPVNISEVSRETGSDFAAKDVMGAPRPREFVGEADERLTFAGTLFPQMFGGLSGIDALQSIARAGQPQMLMRGDGSVFGWYVI